MHVHSFSGRPSTTAVNRDTDWLLSESINHINDSCFIEQEMLLISKLKDSQISVQMFLDCKFTSIFTIALEWCVLFFMS